MTRAARPDPETDPREPIAHSRRAFLALSASSAAAVGLGLGIPLLAGRPAAAEPVRRAAWGGIHRLGEGVWAVVSTPLAARDMTTLANGGFVAGSERVLAIEAFASADGAGWVAEAARAAAGQWPTDVVISHYHGDHVGGLGGYLRDGETPRLWLTAATRDRLAGRRMASEVRAAIRSASVLDAEAPTDLDLGGRTARLVPRAGHTASDVTVELDQPEVVFCGDLVWNEMFPNYVDARPSALSASVRAARRGAGTIYVPGHGPLADDDAYGLFVAVIDHLEAAARASFEKGVPADEAGSRYALPAAASGWTLFSDGYFARAIRAWHKELDAEKS